MKTINITQIRNLLSKCADILENEKDNKNLVDQIDEVIHHIDNNFCVVYYP